MVSIGRASAADKARLLGDRSDMLPVANATRRRKRQHAFVDNSGSASFRQSIFRFVRNVPFAYGVCGNGSDLRLKCLLNVLGIGCSQTVFVAKNPMSPRN
jgi:hypothetical protein